MYIIAIALQGNIEEQLFQLIAVYNYAITYKRNIYINNNHIDEDLRILINDFNANKNELIKINLINECEFNKIPFYFYKEKLTEEKDIPEINFNLCIQGSFKTIKYFNNKTIEFIAKLFLNINNDFYNKAVAIINNITIENKTVMYIKKITGFSNEPDIIYYNNAYEMLGDNERNMIIISDDYEWAKGLLSINPNFHFISNENKCIQMIIMMLVPVIINSNSYLTWWASHINKTKVIVPKTSNIIKINNSICI